VRKTVEAERQCRRRGGPLKRVQQPPRKQADNQGGIDGPEKNDLCASIASAIIWRGSEKATAFKIGRRKGGYLGKKLQRGKKGICLLKI